ncbi:protein BREAKING OF ASYMMETRY IN THE STOMATAL LINEAGE isoform X2 [Mercurialis annua]|uniref:protein BREAKING OF ASYMMETRY IN THE STOMATAL LINEAGE isoform X2 n=1 Tax=Mercurialis annua TaxID=3986 RepID=UPI00215FF1F8|nr:protein BREAKING OF ASYMMETRY IN THE STOMATAL LINEAGE isoform X2 [Mercurialis annua]
MSTNWPITKLIRWRIKDWISCFLACRFPLDNEQPQQLPIKNMVYENKKLSTQNKSRKEKHDSVHFQDEEFIVFCFREDGAFDVVKDYKSDSANKNSRSVNRKLNYGEVVETVRDGSNGKRSIAYGIDSCLKNGEGINLVEEGEEEQCNNLDIKSPSVTRTRSYQLEETENCRALSVESTDSNQSESSTGSFSFPALHWELMGSPVQMPRTERICTRKHNKVSCARFQCCRF